jgi:putative glycosyltransferase (TIGR04372 family)
VNAEAALGEVREHINGGRLSEAETICRSLLSARPGDADALFHLGAVVAQDGKLEAALGHLRQTLDLEPNHGAARGLIGRILLALQHYEEAARELSAALDLLGENKELRTQLATAREYAGDWEGARRCWQQLAEQVRDRANVHPLAPLGIRVFQPGMAATRIGEMAIQLELFAKSGVLGWRPPMIGVLLAPEDRIVNGCLLDYFRPYVQVVSGPQMLDSCANLRDQGLAHNPTMAALPDGRMVPDDRAMVAINRVWQDQGRPPLLSLRQDHAARGRACLAQMGVPPDAWFACLHVRSGGFLNEGPTARNTLRNADVATYLPAVEAIIRRGGWVVRIGDPSMPPLPEMPGVVDYARSSLKSDWMDVYLMAAARFFLGTTSGPWVVAHCFGTPVAMTNQLPFSERPFSDRDLFISKLLRRKDSGEVLPFAEAMAPPFRHQFCPVPYESAGVEVVDNTAEEIVELVEEMMARLDGTAGYDNEDEALQEAFTALASFETLGVTGRAGRAFLRKYKDRL